MSLTMVLSFAKQDIKDKYAGSVLGGLWAFILPLSNILMFSIIFSKIMGSRLNGMDSEFQQYGYSIYLICGIVPWAAFSSTLLRVTNVYRDKSSLIGKIRISLLFLPFYIIISEGFIFIVSMVFFACFLFIIDYPINLSFALVFLVFVAQQLLAFALGLILAVFSVFIQDIREMVPVLVQLWFWLTPIVYVINILPSKYEVYFKLNPFFHYVGFYRDIVVGRKLPDFHTLIGWFLISLLLIFIGIFFLKKLERDIRDII